MSFPSVSPPVLAQFVVFAKMDWLDFGNQVAAGVLVVLTFLIKGLLLAVEGFLRSRLKYGVGFFVHSNEIVEYLLSHSFSIVLCHTRLLFVSSFRDIFLTLVSPWKKVCEQHRLSPQYFFAVS